MKVSELIAALAELPSNLDVGFGDNEYGWTGIKYVQLHVARDWAYDPDADDWLPIVRDVVQLA